MKYSYKLTPVSLYDMAGLEEMADHLDELTALVQ